MIRVASVIKVKTTDLAVNVLSLLYWGGLLSSAFRLFSIDPVVMSVAGSALLFGIGTKALP
jgi:hypothetical protein